MEPYSSLSRVQRREFWRAAIELHQQSGLTAVEFCRREKLNAKTFSAWYRRLLAESSQVSLAACSQAGLVDEISCGPSAVFTPVHILADGIIARAMPATQGVR